MVSLATDLIRVALTWRPTGAATWAGEEAVTTFHMRYHASGLISTFTWPTEMAWLPEQIKSKIQAHWPGAMDQAHPTSAQIVQVKCSHLSTTGHVLDEGAYDVPTGTLVGSHGAGMLPPEVALCVSSWAYHPGSFATGKGRKRGRLYLPYITTSICNDQGRVSNSSGIMDGLVAAYQDFFNDVQGMHTEESSGIDGDYFDVVVASGVDATWHNVDWVSIDDKFDSQRRRQHQAGASRTILPISHA